MDLTVTAAISFELNGLAIEGKTFTVTTPIGSGLANAQAASTALTTEIATYITDVATKLSQALVSGDSDTAVQAVATQLLADAATLTAADPITGTPTPPAT
jgi:hypothetical protein